MAYQYPVVVQNQGLSQMLPSNQLDPAALPVSVAAGNQLRIRSDGLYSGDIPEMPVYYVNSSTGVDAPTGGTKAAPFRTLDYTLSQVNSVVLPSQNIIIAMQAGQQFPLAQVRTVASQVRLTYYGDPIYGDFDSPQITTTSNALMANLTRPIIVPASFTSGAGQIRIAGITGPYVNLEGVQVNLPARPTPVPDPSAYGVMDFYHVTPTQGTGRLRLYGVVVNTLDALGVAGILGILSRTQVTFDEFGTQFLVNGVPAAAGQVAEVLARRPWFIKFYSDVAGNADGLSPFLNPTALNSSNGSGILSLHWTDTVQQQIGATNNVGTYPTLADPNFGLRQYITGLRKNGAVPINVICPRLGL